VLPALGQDLLDPVFFPHIAFAEKFDPDSAVPRQPLGVFPQLLAERFGEPGIIENSHLPGIQIRCHPLGVADLWQRAENQHPVPTTQYSRDLILMPFRQ